MLFSLHQSHARGVEEMDGEKLEIIYHRFNDENYIQFDPIRYVHQFENQAEQELVGLIASSLAFGRVTQIFKAIECIMEIVGGEPLAYISALGDAPEKELLTFRYRFVSGRDIHRLFKVAGCIISTHGSLGAFMRKNYRPGHFLSLVDTVIKVFEGVHYLVPCSLKGSACKRLFLYFRWMVRRDAVDLGLWDFINPSELVMPLDTHIFRVARDAGFTSRRSPSLATALDITKSLRRYSPDDPVKYDWGLAHLGIIANNFALTPAHS
jgi:uncharacterized protein (TIGR02757 family)